MNKIKELIGECETRRDALDHLIAGLRRVEDLFGLPMPASNLADAILAAPRGLPQRTPSRRKTKPAARATKGRKRTPKPATRELSPPPTKPVPDTKRDARSIVIAALTKAGGPLLVPALAAATKLSDARVRKALADLAAEKRVVSTAVSPRRTLWALASGSYAKPVTPGVRPEMEVVFNGAKDQSLSSYTQRLRG